MTMRTENTMESFAYEPNKMEDLFDYGPDLLSDRASFQALVDELYSTDSNMQLDVEFSSRGTSPTGPATPPSSSGGQEEVASPDVEHEHQAFAQGALMTDMLAGMEGSTPNDLMRSGTNVYDALDTIDPSFHNPYLGVPSSTQYPHCQVPAYTWETYPARALQYGTAYNTNFSWMDPAAVNSSNTGTFYHSGTRASIDQSRLIPRSTMIPASQNGSTTGVPRRVTHGYGSMSLESLPSDDMMTRYPQLSSPEIIMSDAGYHPNTSLPEDNDFELSGPPVSAASHHAEPSIVNNSNNIQPQARILAEDTFTFSTESTQALETSGLPIRNDVRASRDQGNSRSPETTRRGMVSRPSSSRGSSPRAMNKGGRSGGLDGNTRAHANQMRKLGACWICAFQRDQCDPGSPCTRCQDRSIRGSLHMLPCSRMHLSDLVHQFLPATMNRQHRREEIISFAKKSLRSWKTEAPIQVYLTSLGLGHFAWDLHEFEPSSQDLLLQKRYKVGISGTWQRIEKRSPPLALKQVNFSQTQRLDDYVDNIVEQYLEDFQNQAYYGEEDSCAMFQSELLRALCSLYISLPDEEDDKTLKGDVRQVIRLLVLTCIMDHPITIVATYQDTAISMMQSHNNPQVYGTWTSPMLANRQLKYFFSEMQTQQYNKSLNRLHQILRKAGDKNKLWMSSFVLMLGIALVLEQCQHLLWIKADAKVARRESSSIDAEWEARSHCNEMDDGFEFLCKLYHCKYRGKHRQKTRYEELKNKTSNAAEAEFAEKIYDIVDRNGGYLLHRQQLTISGMQENNHVSRLVARFLVELMGLTQSSP
ncbi:hypothetical protein D6D15_00907 [Aureobasidium pullulans]|uniref:Zn(2)-C6 fungal-type domain-containing protein n=1 Tax=Aureobasidium pullulans TaxID=5580 RepID=A0A4S9BUP6_AURPU|nr:hypothetical protein D6D15_00907 [Aureobasidium pullulans]